MRRSLALLFCVVAPHAAAATCSISAQGVNFGTYDVFSNANSDSTGAVDVHCDVATGYSLALGTGAGTYAQRRMNGAIDRLGYNLFTDATHATVWGDGTGVTSTVSGSATTASHVVYGRVPARQNVNAGAYGDSLVVTISY